MAKRTWSQFYLIESTRIGKGGQAEVMAAVDRETDERVALKRLTSITSEGTARMRREIEVQGSLSHVRVMPVLRHSHRHSWYSMPLAKRSLKELLPPLDDAEISEVITAGAEALMAAHERRYVHRDITPTNILDIGVGRTHWVLSDWGLVRRHGQTTSIKTGSGEFGTAGFAAPEVWSDAHAADERADIYSLGRVVAWCATGRTLIPNVSVVPEGRWESFVRLTTAHHPSDRPGTAAALLELLAGSPSTSLRYSGRDVPQDVLQAIHEQAARQFPDDFSTMKYVVDREIKAWRKVEGLEIIDIPFPILSVITSQAARQFPVDFSTRLHVIEREAEAWRQIQSLDLPVPTPIAERILAKALREFPEDFSTQLYAIRRDVEAWQELQR